MGHGGNTETSTQVHFQCWPDVEGLLYEHCVSGFIVVTEGAGMIVVCTN